MNSFRRGRVDEIPSADQHDLAWSFRPFRYSLRVFGIDLDVGQPRSKLRRKISPIFGKFMMIYFLVFHLQVLYWIYVDSELKNTAAWIELGMDLIDMISSLLFQLIVFFKLHFKWKGLWQKVEQMEKIINFPTTSYSHLRNWSAILIAFVFAVVKEFTKSK